MNMLIIFLKPKQPLTFGVAVFTSIIRVALGLILSKKLDNLKLIAFSSTEDSFGEKECTLIIHATYSCYCLQRNKSREQNGNKVVALKLLLVVGKKWAFKKCRFCTPTFLKSQLPTKNNLINSFTLISRLAFKDPIAFKHKVTKNPSVSDLHLQYFWQ